MPQHDVLIIGGGVIGVCLAHYLLDAGREVTIVDKGALGSGASHGNAGYITPSHATPLASPASLAEGLRGLLNPESPFYIKPRPDPALLRWLLQFALAARRSVSERNRPPLHELSLLSADLYADLIPRGELDCNYEQLGLLEAYLEPARFAAAQAEAEHLQAAGLPLKVLDREATLAAEPALREDIAGSIHMQRDAHLNPASFVAEMGGWLANRGATLLTDTAVTGFATQGRHITSAQTDSEVLLANEYVLATGSWSPLLAQELGLHVPIQAAKGYSVTVERPPGSPNRPVILMESRVALTPLGKWLRFAGTLEIAGLDLSINQRRVNAILAAVPRYCRPWPETRRLETWAGLRPVTPDGLPIIGRPPRYANLFLAAGHAMLGMSLGAATGYLGAQYLTGKPPEIDLTPFRYGRF